MYFRVFVQPGQIVTGWERQAHYVQNDLNRTIFNKAAGADKCLDAGHTGHLARPAWRAKSSWKPSLVQKQPEIALEMQLDMVLLLIAEDHVQAINWPMETVFHKTVSIGGHRAHAVDHWLRII